MEQFNLLDRVRLLEPIELTGDFSNAIADRNEAAEGTVGTLWKFWSQAKRFSSSFSAIG